MNETNPDSHSRVFGLDLFRAIAIFIVVCAHGSLFLNGTFLNNFPFIRMIDGVDLFFVLSGFLIGGILLKEINREKKFKSRDLMHFWKRRWFRTLPNYYLVLLLNYVIVYSGIIHEDITQFNWKFLVFSQNLFNPFYGFFWESWSLSVEEWFYLLTPVLVFLFLKYLSPKRTFLLATLIMLLVPLLYRLYIFNPSIDDFWYDVTFRKVVFTRLDSIGYGLLAAWIFFYFRGFWDKFRWIFLVAGIALMAFIINYPTTVGSFYKQIVYFTITPISAMLVLPFANSIQRGRGILARGITHISKISYSMYLINLSLVSKVITDNFPPTSGRDGILKYGIYWVIVIVASTLLYRYFEKPLMNLRDKRPFNS